MTIDALAPRMTPEKRLELGLNTLNILTLSILLLIGVSFAVYLTFFGLPSSLTLGIEQLNRIPWLPYLALALSFVCLPVAAELLRGQTLRDMKIFPGRGWILSLGLGLLIGMAWFIISAAFSTGLNHIWELRDGSNLPRWQLLGNYLAVAVCEEVIMRVFIQRRLSEITNPRWAIIITGLIFGFILHLSNPLLSNLIYRVPAGLLLGYLFQRRKTVWAPIAAHWLYDSLPTLMAFLP